MAKKKLKKSCLWKAFLRLRFFYAQHSLVSNIQALELLIFQAKSKDIKGFQYKKRTNFADGYTYPGAFLAQRIRF